MLKDNPKNRNKKNTARENLPQNIARFGPSLFLRGELSGYEDLIIEGQFQGNINLENHNLLIEREGEVKGDIQAKNISINGRLEGNIYASGKVLISKEGQMIGDISAPGISIMDGAQFKGSVKIKKDTEKTSPPNEKHESLPLKKE